MTQLLRFALLIPKQLPDNPFRLIGKEWMLITAGTSEKLNMMTASWGSMGILWGRPVVLCFVRPQLYFPTDRRVERAGSLTFFDAAHRDVLDFWGSHSGRDVDKVAATGLTPVVAQALGAIYLMRRVS